jgi:hypothetical protein
MAEAAGLTVRAAGFAARAPEAATRVAGAAVRGPEVVAGLVVDTVGRVGPAG